MPARKKDEEATTRRNKNEPFGPGEREACLEARKREAATYRNPDMVSGFDLDILPMAAAIVGDEVHLTCRVTGEVNRPDALATLKGQMVVVKIPAIVEREVE